MLRHPFTQPTRSLMVRLLLLDVETDGNGTFRPPTQRPIELAWCVIDKRPTIASFQFVSG